MNETEKKPIKMDLYAVARQVITNLFGDDKIDVLKIRVEDDDSDLRVFGSYDAKVIISTVLIGSGTNMKVNIKLTEFMQTYADMCSLYSESITLTQ